MFAAGTSYKYTGYKHHFSSLSSEISKPSPLPIHYFEKFKLQVKSNIKVVENSANRRRDS